MRAQGRRAGEGAAAHDRRAVLGDCVAEGGGAEEREARGEEGAGGCEGGWGGVRGGVDGVEAGSGRGG